MPVFQYALSPQTVPASASSGGTSVVALTLAITNPTTQSVPCSKLAFSVVYGQGAGALTEKPGAIACAPDPKTPWAVWPLPDGTWQAMPLPPAEGLEAGQSIAFVFSNVVVGTQQGPSPLTITEWTSDPLNPATATATVTKGAPAGSGGALPAVVSFTAAPSALAPGDDTQLSWEVSNAQSATLSWQVGDGQGGWLPGGSASVPVQPDPATPGNGQGRVSVPVQSTTSFTLTALGAGGPAASAQAIVSVEPVAIQSFSASPAGPVAPGTSVTLQWATRYSSGCSIDQGLGPVPSSGQLTVTPQQSTVYTLTAGGVPSLVTQSLSVEVTPAQVATF